jgi:hypothetical protein
MSHHDPLPLRVEGHGALRWLYGPDQLAEFRTGTEVRGYVKAYRSFAGHGFGPQHCPNER